MPSPSSATHRVEAEQPVRVGVLVIGQTPRLDLTSLLDGLPCDLLVRGALDLPGSLPVPEPVGAGYPLTTRLSDGGKVIVDEAWLEPLLQRQLEVLEADGVVATVLLCAGEFPSLRARRPLLHPFRLGAALAAAFGIRRPLVLVPIEGQVAPALRKWTSAGFEAEVHSAPPGDLVPWARRAFKTPAHDALILDYVGYAADTLTALRDVVRVPVIDLGHLAGTTLGALLEPGIRAEI